MKKKLFRQKRKLFVSIALSMLTLNLLLLTIFSIITYNSEKDLLRSNAYSRFADAVIFCTPPYNSDVFFLNQHWLSNTQTVIKDSHGEIVAESKDALSVVFTGDENNNMYNYSCIDYDKFIASMTDEQYKKIADMLTQGMSQNGEYYELVCTGYYVYEDEIFPKYVEIVRTKEENVWYVFDEVIEQIELEPDVPEGLELYKIGKMNRNVIDTDFVLGNFQRHEDLISEFKSLAEPVDSQDYYPDLIRTEGSTYIYMQTSTIVCDQEDGNPTYYHLTYAEKFNVLENCIATIIMMAIYTFVLFLIVGVIIGAITWRSLKKQIIQEENLRTLTNSMAHQLKTPLFIIGGYSESLIEDINTDKRSHYAQLIADQAKSMNELVVKTLDCSKLDSVSFSPEIERFNLTELVLELLESYNQQKIRVNFDGDVMINADRRLMKIAVENLIDNAVKYTADKNEIEIMISHGSFSISNPCKAMSKKELSQLWQPYHRGSDTTNSTGHGLGLAIVKSIFELHKFRHSAEISDNIITFKFRF